MILYRTEIEAVNTILSMVGEAPINSLDLDELAPGQQALTILRQTSRSIQSSGWYFNTRRNRVLHPGVDGTIMISANTLAIIPSRQYSPLYTIRENKLYDIENETDVFTNPVEATLIVALDFTDLPEVFREYITKAAGKTYTSRFSASDLVFKFSDTEMAEAKAGMNADQLRNQRYCFHVRPRRVL